MVLRDFGFELRGSFSAHVYCLLQIAIDAAGFDYVYHSSCLTYLCLLSLQITSDAVGFGFVLRGSCPTYVQAVDPMGPASVAGLKVI